MISKPKEERYTRDFIQSFLIDHSTIRGRLVRLNDTVDTILSRHKYPAAISRLLGELLALASMLASQLKQEGILTIQLKGDGPVAFMVADAVYGGELRGFAQMNPDAPFKSRKKILPLEAIMGKGYIAITLDPGLGGERYQGIVELGEGMLADAVQYYFTQSQQVSASIKLAADKVKNKWVAGGLMIERLPQDGGHEATGGVAANDNITRPADLSPEDLTEQWNHNRILMETITPEELLGDLPSQTILYRLFNEDGVWAFAPKALAVGCRCSRERIINVLNSLPKEELPGLAIKGIIKVHCEFCNKEEGFKLSEIV